MSRYKPFESQRRKMENTFENAGFNSNNTKNDVKLIDTKFRSENHYKPITTITLAEKLLVTTSGQQVSIGLVNFPDWTINMAKPAIGLSFDSAYNPEEEVDSLFNAFSEGTLKNGDLSIIRWNLFHWFTKIDNVYRFNVRFDLVIKSATNVTGFGFSSIDVPVYAKVTLNVINDRNFNELQSGKI